MAFLGEAAGSLTETYISNNQDLSRQEVMDILVENTALALIKSIPKSGIKYAIKLADAEKSVTKQLMDYEDEFGEYLEMFWGQLVDIMIQWGMYKSEE